MKINSSTKKGDQVELEVKLLGKPQFETSFVYLLCGEIDSFALSEKKMKN